MSVKDEKGGFMKGIVLAGGTGHGFGRFPTKGILSLVAGGACKWWV